MPKMTQHELAELLSNERKANTVEMSLAQLELEDLIAVLEFSLSEGQGGDGGCHQRRNILLMKLGLAKQLLDAETKVSTSLEELARVRSEIGENPELGLKA